VNSEDNFAGHYQRELGRAGPPNASLQDAKWQQTDRLGGAISDAAAHRT